MGKRKLTETKQEKRPYSLLCYAVVEQACKDYRVALKVKQRHKHYTRNSCYVDIYTDPDRTIKECEKFFTEYLDLWCDLDGEWIMREIRKRVDGE